MFIKRYKIYIKYTFFQSLLFLLSPYLKYYWLIIVHNSPVSVFTCEKLWIKLLLTICRKKFHLQNTHLHCAYLLSHLCDHIKQSYQTYSVLPLLKNEGVGSRFSNKMNQNRVTSSKTVLATLVEILGPMSVAHSGYHPSVIVSRLSCWNLLRLSAVSRGCYSNIPELPDNLLSLTRNISHCVW